MLGNYIYLNEIDKGVHIIDNTNPAAPVNKYFIAVPGNLDLAVKDNILYADLYRDLVSIDISAPANVQVKSIAADVFPPRMYSYAFVNDPNSVIVDWIKKDTTVAAGDKTWYDNRDLLVFDASGVLASSAAIKGLSGSTARFTLVNNYLYTVTNTDLNVFDISQPAAPVFANKIPVGWQIETIYPFKDNLFLGSKTGVFMFSTSDPASPQLQYQVEHITACDPVIADDNYAYVTLSSGTECRLSFNELDVLNIQDPANPLVVKTYAMTNPHGLCKDGDLLFVCDGAAGLKVYNAADAQNLQLVKSVADGDAQEVIAQNNQAIVVAKNGLYQYSYTAAGELQLSSKLSIQPVK